MNLDRFEIRSSAAVAARRGTEAFGDRLNGLRFHVSPSAEDLSAPLAEDGAVIGYGFGHREDGSEAVIALKADGDVLVAHAAAPLAESQSAEGAPSEPERKAG